MGDKNSRTQCAAMLWFFVRRKISSLTRRSIIHCHAKMLSYKQPTMKKRLTRISILQSSKIMTALYFVMGLLYTLIGIPMVIFGGSQYRLMGIVYCFGPILFGILGFVCFVIFSALYNGLAKWLGGVEIEVSTLE